MNKLEKLFELARNEKINIHWMGLKEIGCLGLTIEKEGLPNMIFLDSSLKKNNYKLIEVLAEELGHHFTSCGNSINSIKTYKDKLDIARCENKATRWASFTLVSEEDIINLVNSNVTCFYDMAEILGVDVKTIMKRLEYLSKKKNMLDLRNGKYLVLTNLPNIYIYEPLL
ncbi:ImmA/IrrE family metallo-endopeptidase [Faecalimicrobium sp. JNUCC 81]